MSIKIVQGDLYNLHAAAVSAQLLGMGGPI